jgi:queuosine precursor transporter
VMVYVYDQVRVWTNGRMLWLRAVTSNVVSMAVNSVLFVVLAFAGVMTTDVLTKMIVVQILFKFIDSFFELGFLYALRAVKSRGWLNAAATPPALAAAS